MTPFSMDLRKMGRREPNRRPQEPRSLQADRKARMLIWGLLTLAATLWIPAAKAQGCPDKLLMGAYGVTGGGTAIGVGPVAFVAVFNFSGDGYVNGIFYQ